MPHDTASLEKTDAYAGAKHSVDILIEERAPRLAKTPFWPILLFFLRPLLGYGKARALADAIAPLSGHAALDYASRLLHLHVETRGLIHVPERGRCIIVINHPTGIADGVAVYDTVKSRRPDFCFFANADAHRVCPGFDDVLIPVAWPAKKRTMQSTKLTVRMAREALLQERAIVIFAAGALSRRRNGVLRDPQWEHSAVSLARKHDAPVIPARLSGPFPALFHFFDRFSSELRDITLFHELLNKAGGDYALVFGAPIDANAISGSSEALTARIKDYVEISLPAAPDARFEG